MLCISQSRTSLPSGGKVVTASSKEVNTIFQFACGFSTCSADCEAVYTRALKKNITAATKSAAKPIPSTPFSPAARTAAPVPRPVAASIRRHRSAKPRPNASSRASLSGNESMNTTKPISIKNCGSVPGVSNKNRFCPK